MNKENGVLDIKKIRKISLLNIIWQWEIILLFIFIMVAIINSNLSPYFLDYTNLMNTTFNFIEKAIIALPMIFVIICGDIDISVASIIALSSVFMGMASQAGVNTFGLVVVGLFSGSAAGFLNGFIITKFGIPAIAVTLGAGRSEVMQTIFGIDSKTSGDVFINGEKVNIANPSDAMNHGLAYLPEDRQIQGAILAMNVRENITLPIIDRISRHIFLDRNREFEITDEYGKHIEIKASGWEQLVEDLSGGNQQKVVLAKWIATKPR
ncbi:unnamed protein product, partial [marine sediment metagenome]